jgi:PAS domain S-box-containing protein
MTYHYCDCCAMNDWIDRALPPALRHSALIKRQRAAEQTDPALGTTTTRDSVEFKAAEEHRRAVLVIHVALVASVSIFLVMLLLCFLGFEQTAMNVSWLLPLQPLPVLVLWLTLRADIASHAFLGLLFLSIAWDFGPDNGLAVLASIALATGSWPMVGIRGGVVWTCIGVLWAGVLGPFVIRADDFSPVLSLATAVITLVTGIATGIAEKVRASAQEATSAALRELDTQRDSMRTFVEVAFPAWIETRGGELTRVSGAAAHLIGEGLDDMIGRRLTDFIHPEDLEGARQRFREAPGHGFRTELRVPHSDGSWLWLEAIGVPLAPDGNKDARQRWMFGMRNIVDERRGRERLIQAQKLESVGQLAAGIAHDFNNLLTVVNGYAELLPASDSRTHILRAGRDAAKLTADIMSFARSAPSSSDTVDLVEQIYKWQPVFESLLGEKSRLRLDLPVTAHACISEAQLSQLLLNLVSNARDALPAGGDVHIRVLVDEAARNACESRGREPGEHVCIIVRDTGVGMSEEVRSKAFDPFFTTKSLGQGTGLGLASVYGIVHQQGGLVEITSTPGAGTEVLSILPRRLVTDGPIPRIPARTSSASFEAKVLLLEDNTLVGNLVSEALRKSGYHVDVCTTIASAHARFESSKYDLLITDVVLTGEFGTDFAMELRRQHPTLPVLLISGYADVETSRWRADVDGRSAFLGKPFSIEALLREVRYLVPEQPLLSILSETSTAAERTAPVDTSGLHLPQNRV